MRRYQQLISQTTASLLWPVLMVFVLNVAACAQQGKNRGEGMETNHQETRTPAQDKIDSRLLSVIKSRRGHQPAAPVRQAHLNIDEQGRTVVDLDARVSDELIGRIRNLNGVVISSFVQFNAIRVNFPVDELERLASDRDIKFIRPAAEAQTDSDGRSNSATDLISVEPIISNNPPRQSKVQIQRTSPAQIKRHPRRRTPKRIKP